MEPTLRCPECGTPASPLDFQCPSCELILNPEATTTSAEYPLPISVIRALLSPPERSLSQEIPLPPQYNPNEDKITARYEAPMDDNTIPRLLADLDLAVNPLHPFEAYVVSFVDGSISVPALAKSARLQLIEVEMVLRSLVARNVVELERLPDGSAEAPVLLVTKRNPSPSQPNVPVTLPPTPPPVRNAIGLQERPTLIPERAENVLQRAVALERSGQVEGAIHVLSRALEKVKEPAPIYNKLALILVNQRRDLRQAEMLLKKALALDPHNPVYQQNLYKIIGRAATDGGRERTGLFSRLKGK